MPEAMTGIDIRVASDAPEAAARIVARHFGIGVSGVAPWEDVDRLVAAMNGSDGGWVAWHPAGTGSFPSLVCVDWPPGRGPAPAGQGFAGLVPVLQAVRKELGVDIAVPDENHPSPLVLLAFREDGVTEAIMDEDAGGGDIRAAPAGLAKLTDCDRGVA